MLPDETTNPILYNADNFERYNKQLSQESICFVRMEKLERPETESSLRCDMVKHLIKNNDLNGMYSGQLL